ncbi:MAG: HEAT repeat domain-containing protein [Asgard group archaeon]|nr:HEAT repeat domain-containing protein [Asgard group archaeon]
MATDHEVVSIRTIKQQLKSNNSVYRIGALYLMLKYDFPENNSLLKDVIKRDSEISVRNLALLVLNEKKDPDIVTVCKRLFFNTTDNHIVRGRAIWILGQIKNLESYEILISALDDRKEEVVYWAVLSLSNYNDHDAILEVLTKLLLKHRSNIVRSAIINYLGLTKNINSISILEDRLLNDGYSLIRLQSAWVLRLLGSLKSIKPLCRALNTERNDLARREIALAIGMILQKQLEDVKNSSEYITNLDLAVETLLKAFTRDTEYIIRRTCAEALGRIKDKRILPVLIDKISLDTNHFVRKEIIQTLGKIGDPQALDVLFEAQKSQYRTIVEAAKEAIKKIHSI